MGRGLKGQDRTPQQDPRARRNADRFSGNASYLFSGALTVNDEGFVVLDLTTDGGLSQAGDSLTIVVAAPIALDAGGVHLDYSTGLQVVGGDLKTKDTEIDHDSLLNFLGGEHYLQTVITHLSTALATGLVKVTTGTGALSVVADASGDWNTAFGWGDHAGLYDAAGGLAAHLIAFTHADIALNTTHRGSDGSNHTFLDQSVVIAATPTFAGLTIVNAITEFSTDGTLGGNSDSAVPTERAVKTYADGLGAAAGIGMNRVWMGC